MVENLGPPLGGEVDDRKLREMFDGWCEGDWDTNLEGAPNSESLADLIGRVVPAFQSIFKRHSNDDGTILIIAHGGTISWTMPAFVQNVSMNFAVENYLGNCCSVSVLSNRGKPHAIRWADQQFT